MEESYNDAKRLNFQACIRANKELISLLLDKGADIHAKCYEGKADDKEKGYISLRIYPLYQFCAFLPRFFFIYLSFKSYKKINCLYFSQCIVLTEITLLFFFLAVTGRPNDTC